MSLLDLLTAPWAVTPEKLLEMQELYRVHLRGDKIDVAAIEARIGRPLANDQKAYELQQGAVAVLNLEGVIAPKANLFMQICGGISAQEAIKQIDGMAADQQVRSAVLAIDSPGGSVQLIPAVAQAVARLAAAKPTVSVSTGAMCSALYWIGSAANAVFISGATDMVGSIGVVATHNYSPRATGTVTTEITAGKFKRIASPGAPLSKEGAAYMQSQVDELYRVFVEAVATNRGATTDQVITHMADGRVWIGQQAVDRGLVDGVSTVNDMVAQLAADPTPFASRRKAVIKASKPRAAGVAARVSQQDAPVLHVVSPTQTEKEVTMTPQELAAQFAAENPEAAALLRAEGVSAELQRVKDVRASAMPGHEALVDQLAADGKTTGGEAAMAVLAAERKARTDAAAAHAADAPAAAASSAAPQGNGTELTKAEQVEKANAYAAEKGVDFVAALKALGFAA